MNIPNGPSKLYLSGSFYPLIVNSEEIVCSEHLTSLKTEDRLILIIKNVGPPPFKTNNPSHQELWASLCRSH